MFKNILFLVISLILCDFAYGVKQLTPGFKEVELKEFSTLDLKVLPDAGTQLIFPFKLDNPELQPRLKIRLTNADGFSVPTEKNDLQALVEGQNTITILGKANPSARDAVYIGNLFINIGGYNISIALKTTYKVKEHVSNIVFKLPNDKRTHMIENMVKQRTEELEKRFKDINKNIDKVVDDRSLIHVAKLVRMKKKITKYKEQGNIVFDGNRLVVFSDKVESYGDKYHILLFEVTNKSSNDFLINGADFVVFSDNTEETILGSLDCPERLLASKTIKCSFATSQSEIKTSPKIKMLLRTDRGQGEFTW